MTIQYFADFRNVTGCKQEQWPYEPDVSATLHSLCAKYSAMRKKVFLPGTEELGAVVILVNGRHIAHLKGLETPLRQSDTVQIFPVVAGGK